jgi:hypothetical protein
MRITRLIGPIAFTVGISIGLLFNPPVAQEVTNRPIIEEDMPGWDCATMGNRICGTDEFYVAV